MSLRFFYVDESYDSEKFCLSAIGIRYTEWKEAFLVVKQYRERLKRDFGFYLRKEIHATEFVAGRGRPSKKDIPKWQRAKIFSEFLGLISLIPNVLVFNVCLETKAHTDPQMTAWDRIINRIERTLLEMEKREIPLRKSLVLEAQKSVPKDKLEDLEMRLNLYRARAIIIADDGREHDITKALRKMGVFNPIPSKYGTWNTGSSTQNIPAIRIIEDPIFKASSRSHFIQLADCLAFSLLKREVKPTDTVKRYGIDKVFDKHVAPICYKAASPKDPHGIVRK